MRKRSHQVTLTQFPPAVDPLLPVDLPQPWDAKVLFGRVAPLELEIGSGRGLFITQAAENTPDHDFLGIEISKKYASLCALKIAKKQLRNATMVCADAHLVLREIIPDNSLTAVHIYFPDPWWKRRHRKRRIVCEPVMCLVHQKLIDGGLLHFWTDVEEYFLAGLHSITQVKGSVTGHKQERSRGFDGPFEMDEHPKEFEQKRPETPAEHDCEFRTHYERRVRLHNEPVYRSLFRKTEGQA